MKWWTLLLSLMLATCMVGLIGCSGDDETSTDTDATDDADTNATEEVEERAVFSFGTATILGTYMFDFDAGSGGNSVVPAGHTADVWWERMTEVNSQLVPMNEARIAELGAVDFDSVTIGDVEGAGLADDPIQGALLPAGTVVAYETADGHFGKFTITGYAGNQDMSIRWVTWE